MTIGVVVPAYNAERWVGDAIASVPAQSYSDWRLVVVDDGSTDATRQCAEAAAGGDGRIEVVSRANGGLSEARNTGYLALRDRADAFLFLDADDALMPGALALLGEALVRTPPAFAGVYGFAIDADEQLGPLNPDLPRAYGYRRKAVHGRRLREMQPDEPLTFEALAVWVCIETAGQVLLRREALERAGPWRTMPGEDWEYWLRLAARGPFQPVLAQTLLKRGRDGSLSSSGRWLARAEPIIRRSLATSARYTPEQRRAAGWGHLYSCQVRLEWAVEKFRKRHGVEALKDTLRAARSFGRFLPLVPEYARSGPRSTTPFGDALPRERQELV